MERPSALLVLPGMTMKHGGKPATETWCFLATGLLAAVRLLAPTVGQAQPIQGKQPQSVEHSYVGEPAVAVSTWVSGLEIPWSLVFLPDGRALVSERRGRILL